MFFIQCQTVKAQSTKHINTMKSTENKMVVEIWSDVMCPFCYIGKRKFETALNQFKHKDKVNVVWKSFQLAPDLKTDTSKTIHQFLSEHKGMPLDQAKQMNDQMSTMAKQSGLTYNFDQSVVANSFDAHRFSHFAKEHGVQNEAEEKLFAAYFTEGKNIADHETLAQLGVDIGLDANEMKAVLTSDKYAEDVENDSNEAQQIGVRGVPFFAVNRKYAISGAQESSLILETLEKSFAEWQKENPQVVMEVVQGAVCTPDGECK